MQLGEKFFQEKGLKHVQLSTADGALEAAPAMGTADAILDLVSSGTTLRENNLKEINGGAVLSSQVNRAQKKTSNLTSYENSWKHDYCIELGGIKAQL
jgi:ATP phosphoribosyltransferase